MDERAIAALPSAIGEQIRHAREATGLSVDNVAARCRLTKNTVLAVEAGHRGVPLATVARICVAIGVRLSRVVEKAENAGMASGWAPWFDAPTDVIDIRHT